MLQALCSTPESEEAAGLSSVAKQGAEEGSMGGNITDKLLCKKTHTKKMLALFIWNVWSLLGNSYLLGKES